MVENAGQGFRLDKYAGFFRNHWWLIYAIFMLVAMTGTYVTNDVLPQVYDSAAEVQVRSPLDTPVPAGSAPKAAQSGEPAPADLQADLETIRSESVLRPVITSLDLDKIWGAQQGRLAGAGLTSEEALAKAKSVVRVSVKPDSKIIEVTASSEDPQLAAAIANAVAQQFKTVRDQEMGQHLDLATNSLRDQIDRQQKAVEAVKANAENLREEAIRNGVDLPTSGEAGRTETDLDSRKKDLLTAKEDYDSRQVLLEQMHNLSDDDFVNTLAALGRQDPNITALRAANVKTQEEMDNLVKDGFDQKHPRVQTLQTEMDRRSQQVKDLIVGIRHAMEADAQMAQSRVALLQKEVDELTKKAGTEQSTAVVPLREAQNDIDKQQSLLDAYSIRLRQVETDNQLVQSPVTVLTPAVPSGAPARPDKNLYTAASVLAGLLVALASAFLIESLDTSVKIVAEAESLLGLPVLTIIPSDGGPMPMDGEAGSLRLAESYRILRAKLDLKVESGIGPAFAILSGGPGEGKTTTLYNLALVCAWAGQSVILVDADFRRPRLHELVHLPNQSGLANYLRGEGEAVNYVQQSPVPKIHLLSSGDLPFSEMSLLTGEKIRGMLEDLKQRYDVVLVDSPPVLGVDEGALIAREVDYAILIVQYRRYAREIALRARRTIEEARGNCIGVVLNRVGIRSDDTYYSYSTYYQKPGAVESVDDA